ncbi:MAG: glycosyltransferase family 4 protein [Patescibacteria group bacterium]
MKLLIITQKVDRNDPILGFFHRWIEEFAKDGKILVVVCLQKGEYNLPNNVKVLSLGKPAQGWPASGGEKLLAKLVSFWRFYKYLWHERKNYNAVFVHMNQEYVLLGGFYWRIFGKPIFMWRNHPVGDWRTNLAAKFCAKIFCTSKFSYTAKFSQTVLMPVGIDTNIFKPIPSISRYPNSILFLARIAPIKRPDLLLEALKILDNHGIKFSASLYGGPLPVDQQYFNLLKQKVASYGMLDKVKFQPSIPNTQTPAIYNRHEIFVNLSSSGMYDKTIFEAMACGCLVLASNDNLRGQIDERLIITNGTSAEVADKLCLVLSLSDREKARLIDQNIEFAKTQSLDKLVDKLNQELYGR